MVLPYCRRRTEKRLGRTKRQKYYLANAQLMTGWRKIDNKQYYFNEDGTMATGWITIDGKSYFLKEDGSLDATAKK